MGEVHHDYVAEELDAAVVENARLWEMLFVLRNAAAKEARYDDVVQKHLGDYIKQADKVLKDTDRHKGKTEELL